MASMQLHRPGGARAPVVNFSGQWDFSASKVVGGLENQLFIGFIKTIYRIYIGSINYL